MTLLTSAASSADGAQRIHGTGTIGGQLALQTAAWHRYKMRVASVTNGWLWVHVLRVVSPSHRRR